MSESLNSMLHLPGRHPALWILPKALASLVDWSSFQTLGTGYTVIQWMEVRIHTRVFVLHISQESFSCK